MTTFNVEIALGNDAMQGKDDVASALKVVATELESWDQHFQTGTIRDGNGNTVGTWWIEEDEVDEAFVAKIKKQDEDDGIRNP